MKKLSSEEEVAFLVEINARPEMQKVFEQVREGLNVLQVRSQMLLGLITICLTITGFSGHMIAQSGAFARVFVFVGVISVLASAVVIVFGPMHVIWLTGYRADTLEETASRLIARRNMRTRIYHLASGFLLIGLTGYVISLGFFLLSMGA